MAGSRSQTLLRPSRDWSPLTQSGSLTLSAGVITDDTRLAGVEGDGATYPASMAGVWPAATNLVPNGGFTTNATGWAALNSTLAAGAGSIARSTAQSKFGGASLLVTPVSQYDSGGIQVALTTGTQYTLSMWVYPSATMNFGIAATDPTFGDNFFVNGTTAGGTWTKVKLTFTTTKTASYFIRGLAFATSPPPFYIDGVHLETGSIATPYIETDGGTASRSAGRIQIPASVLDETQSWAAFRMRMGWVNTADPSGNPVVFDWRDDANNLLQVRFDTTGNTWELQRRNTGGTGEVTLADTFALADEVTVVAAWDAGNLKISVDGSAFTSAAAANIPVLAAATLDAGSIAGTSEHICAALEWSVAGKGTLANADAAMIHAWGNNDPLPHMFPRSAQLTFLARFNGDGTAYRYAA